jgi:histidinol-phosphate aminotransferase
VNEFVEKILEERSYLRQELEKFPYILHIHPSDANFLLVQVPDANRFYEGLIKEKVIVRNRSTVLHCEGCLRITVGTRDETLALLQAFEKIATN